jgi:hypothetical protein
MERKGEEEASVDRDHPPPADSGDIPSISGPPEGGDTPPDVDTAKRVDTPRNEEQTEIKIGIRTSSEVGIGKSSEIEGGVKIGIRTSSELGRGKDKNTNI